MNSGLVEKLFLEKILSRSTFVWLIPVSSESLDSMSTVYTLVLCPMSSQYLRRNSDSLFTHDKQPKLSIITVRCVDIVESVNMKSSSIYL